MRAPTAVTAIAQTIARYHFSLLASEEDSGSERLRAWALKENEDGWTYEYAAGPDRTVRVEGVYCTPAELEEALTRSQRILDTDPELLGATCQECGTPISGHAAKYRGVTRCRSCAAKHRHQTQPPSTRFDAASASKAANTKHAQDRENARLAGLARANGLA